MRNMNTPKQDSSSAEALQRCGDKESPKTASRCDTCDRWTTVFRVCWGWTLGWTRTCFGTTNPYGLQLELRQEF